MSLKQGSSKRLNLRGFKMMYKLQGCSKAEYNTDLVYEAWIDPKHYTPPETNPQNPGAMPRMLVIISDLASDPKIPTTGSMSVDMEFVMYARLFRRKMLGLS